MKKIIVFQENENYDLRSDAHPVSNSIDTAHFGTNTITNLGPKVLKLSSGKMENVSTLSVFKRRIKTWTINNCGCRLCKYFIKDLGFIEVCPNL